MLSVPGSKVVRGFSFFGASFVYVMFEDGTDIYWARSRVLEYLNLAAGRLPRGVTPALGPDATGVGWVYQYALVGAQQHAGRAAHAAGLVPALRAARRPASPRSRASAAWSSSTRSSSIRPSCAPTASRWRKVAQAIRERNRDVGGRVIEMAEAEYMVRGRGYLRGTRRHRATGGARADKGTPVLVRDVARVELGPDERRGIAELNGEGEVVSGIVDGALRPERAGGDRQRQGQDRGAGEPACRRASRSSPTYDRSDLIQRAIDTLKRTLLEESLIVALVCVVFLLHVRSALVAIVTLPVGVLIAFIAMRLAGHQRQHHDPGRHRHRHRRDGRRGDRDDRERAQAPRARCSRASRAPQAMIDACQRGRAGAVLLAADHHPVVPAGVHARRRRRGACSRRSPSPRPSRWPAPRCCR